MAIDAPLAFKSENSKKNSNISIKSLSFVLLISMQSDRISMLISSPEAMTNLGKELAQHHKILLLYGDLGAGKTTLAKGFAETLGINPQHVQSPTYTYLNIYDNKLLHLDMYRLNSFEEMVEKGIIDQMNDYDYILIERPKRTQQLELGSYTEVHIEKSGPSERKIILTNTLPYCAPYKLRERGVEGIL